MIFDTNVLYQTYNQRADFTTFSFNRTYENVIGIINQFDIYERVTISIPNVVWREMKKQIVDAHNRKLEEQKKHVLKWIFPEYSINENNFSDYATYINEKVDEYKRGLSSDINKVIELQLPTNGRFQRIVERAFKKEAPFGGKDKYFDKGFKDVLL
ncbi:MAG: PIN domain-containing protein [Eubacterium sp.]|nr:PIN domain-containing protein [Eubacterium sp.]